MSHSFTKKSQVLLIFAGITLSSPSVAQTNQAASIAEFPKIHTLNLVRPMAHSTLDILLSEADSLYRGQRLGQAKDTLIGLLELNESYSPAWLRLGNIWQQEGNAEFATKAYQNAAVRQDTKEYGSDLTPKNIAEAQLKAKLNLTALHLSAVKKMLAELETVEQMTNQLQAAKQAVELSYEELAREQQLIARRFSEKRDSRVALQGSQQERNSQTATRSSGVRETVEFITSRAK